MIPKIRIDNVEGEQADAATVEDGFWAVVVGAAAEASIQSGRLVHIGDLSAFKGVRVD